MPQSNWTREPQLLSRSNWAREPQLLSLRIWSLCSSTREAAIVRGHHFFFFFFFKFYLFIYLFIYFWLCWVFGSCEGFL